jgi:HAUS augmin-like complex subunit 6 N-terminus
MAHLLLNQKLRPFFPPLAPLQSLNLRAALYRGLTDLKKNGILGKEVILRKTMLDECKGDKFEELVRVFAIAVLRKEASRRSRSPTSIPTGYSEILTLPENLTSKQSKTLMPLVLAHRQILQPQLGERRRINERFRDDKQCLDDANTRLAEDRKVVLSREGKLPVIQLKELDWISDHVRATWTGNEQWTEVLIHGGPGELDQVLLGKSLSSRTLKVSGTTEDESSSSHPSSLLADLNERIKKQQFRLQNWEAFRASLEESKSSQKVETTFQTKKSLLKSSAHQGLQPVEMEDEVTSSTKRLRQAHPEESELIEAMRAELAILGGSCRLGKSPSAEPKSLSYALEDVQQRHECASTTDNVNSLQHQAGMSDIDKASDEGRKGYNGHHDRRKNAADVSKPVQLDVQGGMILILDFHLLSKSLSSSTPSSHHEGPRPSNTSTLEMRNAQRFESYTSQNLPVSPSRYHDEDSTPRPNKGCLDRLPLPTRLLNNEVHPQQSTQPTPPEPAPDIQSTPESPSSPPKPLTSTLLERTRQSMALLPTPSSPNPSSRTSHPKTKDYRPKHQQHQQQKPNEPRPSSQNFPINQFSTLNQKHPHHLHLHHPHLPSTATLRTDSSSTRSDVDLFSAQADYASVFKSRPKSGS